MLSHPLRRPPAPPLGTKSFGALARTPLVSVGWYRCAHTHARRGAEELAPAYTLNFPRRGVYVKHLEGREHFVAPGSIVFFNRGECWCTSHPHGVGDAGLYLSVRHDAVLELARAHQPSVVERPERVFTSPLATATAELELAAVALARDASVLEPVELEERVLELADAALLRARRVEPEPCDAARHRALAEAARAELVRRARQPLGLDELAKPLGVSVYHLCRVFRARFGTSVHAELVRQRLASALEEVADGSRELGELAHALGFASHSHFTLAFRRRFGITPSAWRASRPKPRGA
ncbi:MAG: helix-turn-helix domain-containing protein [Planctomycetes bacterium]|nr:helix-turn-helix domain-containing protein [Planctomycetota bacterium]